MWFELPLFLQNLGEADLKAWCSEAGEVLTSLSCKGTRDQLQSQIDTHRNFFVKTVNMQVLVVFLSR